jgi:cyclin C
VYVSSPHNIKISVIQILGEQLKLRQQVIATATVYFKRFYARHSLKCIDPLLLAPTCVFLASKVEEFGVISNSRLITTCQNVGKYIMLYRTYHNGQAQSGKQVIEL